MTRCDKVHATTHPTLLVPGLATVPCRTATLVLVVEETLAAWRPHPPLRGDLGGGHDGPAVW